MRRILTTLMFAALCAAPAAPAAPAATLRIVAGAQRVTYTGAQLLARRDLRTLHIVDSIYGRSFTRFEAVPLAGLFAGLKVPSLAVIQCDATDGFSAVLRASRLLATEPGTSTAYLAIEDPAHPWPRLPGKTASAGPFYVVWTNSRASAIGAEEWPYQIAAFQVLSDPRAVFPHAYPAGDAAANVTAGFRVFQKNCFACHRMNGDGAASIGPDLNRPMNPTAYLTPRALLRLIRDPASVRSWPGMQMHGFSVAAISNADLADLIAYLAYMRLREPAR